MVNIERHPDQRGVYRLTTELTLPVSRDEVFEFFADAYQLERITPPWLHFSVQTPRPIEMRPGTLIDYKLRLHGIPIRWRTRITEWEPPFRFVDEQLVGPYRLWRHLHTFEEVDGQTVCRDQVDYAVPGGALVHWMLVKRDVRKIFEYRRENALAYLFQETTNSNQRQGLKMFRPFNETGKFSLLIVLCIAANSNAQETMTDTWRQWRGPSRDGRVVGTKLPESLADLKEVWKVELGPSYSGPIVGTDRVFVTETEGKKVEVVRALDRKTGKELWKQQWEGAISVPFFAKANGDWIRSTPAYDGERLYVAGIREVLVCLDGETGKELWRLDFVKELKSKVPSFGCASSPVLLGDHVYIQAGGFSKVDKLTGEIKWRVLDDGGGMSGGAFSSPYFTELNGKPQFVVQTRATLAGVDPEDGKVLWSQKVPAFRGMNIVTPTVHKNAVFTSAYGGRSFLFATTKNESDWTVEESWTNKAQGYMSSPIIIKDHLYIHLRNQRFACMNLETGESTWTTTPFGKYWSMVTDGEKILALDERGDLILIRANPDKFELLDQRKVADDSWAHVAVVGDEIFIRALKHMAVYRWE